MIRLNDQAIFVADISLFYDYFSDDEQIINEVLRILDYLKYRKFNKQIYLPTSLYNKVDELFGQLKYYEESYRYFKNYFDKSDSVDPHENVIDEIFLLCRLLKAIYEKVYVISNSIHGDSEFLHKMESLGVQVFTVHEAYSYVWSKKDFRDYMETYVKNKLKI